MLSWVPLACLWPLTRAFIAYDCGGMFSNASLSYGQFDLTRVIATCGDNIRAQYENSTSKRSQVLKFIPNPKIELARCIVRIDLFIGSCGAGFLTTMAHQMTPLYKKKGYKMNKLDCETAHANGTWNIELHGKRLVIQSKGQEEVYTTYLHGRVYEDSGCEPASFYFAGKAHNRAILKAEIMLTSSKILGTLSTDLSEIYVKDQVKLNARDGFGYDDQHGAFMWNVTSIPSNTCERFKTVFAGIGNFYMPKEESSHLKPLLMAQSKDKNHSATLKLLYKTSVCGREAFRSNLDNIYVLLHGEYNEHLYTDLDTGTIGGTDVDLYENILSIAHGNYLTMQLVLDTSFASVSSGLCKQEEVSALQALTDWEETGGALVIPGQNQGILAKQYGDSGVLFACSPVQAKIRAFDKCCKELPIQLVDSEDEVFMEAVTHKITEFCTSIPCSDTIKPLWLLDGTWFSINSKNEAHLAKPPDVIKVGNSTYTESIWRFSINKGIYSEKQLSSLWRLQEVGKAREVSQDQLHRLFKGTMKAEELSDLAEKIPDVIIDSIHDQVLSPGMTVVNRGFKYLKIAAIVIIILVMTAAVAKCYKRLQVLRNLGSKGSGICTKLLTMLSTVGIVAEAQKLHKTEAQCSQCMAMSDDIENLRSEVKIMRARLDELSYGLQNLKACDSVSLP